MGLSSPRFEIGDDLPHAVDAAGADRVEKLCRELGKHRANAAAGDDRGPGPSEKIRKLSHPIEVWLQPRQENQVILFRLKGIERAMPVLVIQADIESLRVDQRRDMKPAYWLHHIARTPLDPARPQMCADYKSAPFFRVAGKETVQTRQPTSCD